MENKQIIEHALNIELSSFNRNRYLVVAQETCKHLGWGIEHFTAEGFSILHDKGPLQPYLVFTIQNNRALVRAIITDDSLTGISEQLCSRFTTAFYETLNAISARQLEEGEAALNIIFRKSGEQSRQQQHEKGISFKEAFIPKGAYFVTPIIISLNILIFVAMVVTGIDFFSPDTEAMITWGANYKPTTMNGEWWRLISCCFLHFGIIHLGMNMYCLFQIGRVLEPLLGRLRFALAYLLCGMGGSVASLAWNDIVVSAGASGAIFGMFGLFIALLTSDIYGKQQRTALLKRMLTFVALNFFLGLSLNFDNAGHAGGLITGLLIGFTLLPGLRKPQHIRLNKLLTLSVFPLILVLVVAGVPQIRNDFPKYLKNMESFSRNEEEALKAYELPAQSPDEKTLSALENGIRLWKENEQLLQENLNMEIPAHLKSINSQLMNYCKLRKSTYEFQRKAIAEQTTNYNDSIIRLDAAIKKILDDFKTPGK